LLVHIGDLSSNQATTLESQVIHMNQELFGQTLSEHWCESIHTQVGLDGVTSNGLTSGDESAIRGCDVPAGTIRQILNRRKGGRGQAPPAFSPASRMKRLEEDRASISVRDMG
jgi:hypothetical protein